MKSAQKDNIYAYALGSTELALEHRADSDNEETCYSPASGSDQHCSLQHFSVEKNLSGIAVVMLDHMGSATVLPMVQLESVQIAFFSLYSGQIDVDWECYEESGRTSFTPGNYALLCSAGSYSFSMKTDVPCKMVGIALTPDTLSTILGPEDTQAVALTRICHEAAGACICWQDAIPSVQVSLAGAQLLACPMTGKGRKLYVESKSIELLSVYLGMLQGQRLQFDGFSHREDIHKFGFDGFSRDDIQKLYNARNLLVERMVDPPGISELSRLCCVNEFKLKKGFKKLFRQTVFEVLRKERMEQAKRLIEDKGYSVSSAAYEVGYSSVSRFIAAFRGEYGATPGDILRKKR